MTRLRQTIAALIFVFAFGVLAYSMAEVYQAWFGVPSGLTGARAKVALPGKSQIEVAGGFVRSVEAEEILVHATAPDMGFTIANRSAEHQDFKLRLQNVKPDAITVSLVNEQTDETESLADRLRTVNANAISFSTEVAPRSVRRFLVTQEPQHMDEVRFYVFAGVRKVGLPTLERMLDIVNEELPDFVVGLGEIYYRANVGKIIDLDQRLSRSRVPVYLFPGEIEYRSQEKASSADGHELAGFYKTDRHSALFGPTSREFSYEGWRFVFMDNAKKRNGSALRWLDGLPSHADTERQTLFFSHIPPFDPRPSEFKEVTRGHPREHERSVRTWENLGVAAAFFGHYHGYFEREVDGVPCYVSSAAGNRVPEGHDLHFLEVTLREGKVSVIQRSLDFRRKRAEADAVEETEKAE